MYFFRKLQKYFDIRLHLPCGSAYQSHFYRAFLITINKFGTDTFATE